MGISACFGNNTELETSDGLTNIANVKPGDLVLTESRQYTPVVENVYIPGEVNMVTTEFVNPVASLAVTEHHWALIKNGSNAISVKAAEINAGMTMLRSMTVYDEAVTAVTKSVAPGRWALSTGACTVFANGILTGTMCANQSSFRYREIMQKETETHMRVWSNRL
jgi:hypothetical protein